jgi:hypothetical protein
MCGAAYTIPARDARTTVKMNGASRARILVVMLLIVL